MKKPLFFEENFQNSLNWNWKVWNRWNNVLFITLCISCSIVLWTTNLKKKKREENVWSGYDECQVSQLRFKVSDLDLKLISLIMFYVELSKNIKVLTFYFFNSTNFLSECKYEITCELLLIPYNQTWFFFSTFSEQKFDGFFFRFSFCYDGIHLNLLATFCIISFGFWF